MYQSVKRRVQQRPFALFGAPFVGSILLMSYVLSNFTQARYDHHEAHVHQLNEEEALQLSKDRRKVDVREEYYVRLSILNDVTHAATSAEPSADARVGAEASPAAAWASGVGHGAARAVRRRTWISIREAARCLIVGAPPVGASSSCKHASLYLY